MLTSARPLQATVWPAPLQVLQELCNTPGREPFIKHQHFYLKCRNARETPAGQAMSSDSMAAAPFSSQVVDEKAATMRRVTSATLKQQLEPSKRSWKAKGPEATPRRKQLGNKELQWLGDQKSPRMNASCGP